MENGRSSLLLSALSQAERLAVFLARQKAVHIRAGPIVPTRLPACDQRGRCMHLHFSSEPHRAVCTEGFYERVHLGTQLYAPSTRPDFLDIPGMPRSVWIVLQCFGRADLPDCVGSCFPDLVHGPIPRPDY